VSVPTVSVEPGGSPNQAWLMSLVVSGMPDRHLTLGTLPGHKELDPTQHDLPAFAWGWVMSVEVLWRAASRPEGSPATAASRLVGS
jgi:hypothetical protein